MDRTSEPRGAIASPSGTHRAASRLPPYKKILMPTLTLSVDSKDLAAMAVGLVRDLSGLMGRLGDVLIVPLATDSEGPIRASVPRMQPIANEAVDRMLEEWSAHFVITGELRPVRHGFAISVALRGEGGTELWGDEVELVDGLVQDARLVLAANAVQAATGKRKDVRRARQGGTRSIEAYKRACLARYPKLDPEKRVSLLQEAVRIDPGYAEAELLLADRLESQGRRDEARRMLRAVARTHPHFSWARQRHGVALRVAGRADEAIEEVQAALDSDPDGGTLFHAGLFAEVGGDPTTAATLYQRAVERGCIDPILCEKLGRLRANAGRYSEALALWERAIELEPGMTHLLGNLALACHHLGDDDEADRLFSRALREAPGKFTTHANRAVFLQDLGRHAEAVEACDEALSIRADSALLLNNRGVSRMELGDLEGARVDYERALESGPGRQLDTYIRANLARVDRGGATLDEASRLFRQGAELVKNNSATRAVPLLMEALDLHRDSWEGWLFLALAYRDLRDWERASEALWESLQLEPDRPDLLSERALVMLSLHRWEEAVASAGRAVELAPDSAPFRCNLGLALMESGELEKARDAFEEADTLDPDDAVVLRCLKEVRRRARKDSGWGESWSRSP
ncbi:MAG: tetratricopeptide repeat protein [Deltaproteobacteria bacterium]|nr:tetratricopeptide repeat protein [Deltaproteobacteria bacterium]